LRKQIIFKSTFILLLVLLGWFLYIIGKEHKLIIDNKEIISDSITYSDKISYKVFVDNQELGTIEKDDRMVAKVAGMNHIITLEEIKNGSITWEKYEKKFRLQSNEDAKLSIPAIINNKKEWLIIIKK